MMSDPRKDFMQTLIYCFGGMALLWVVLSIIFYCL